MTDDWPKPPAGDWPQWLWTVPYDGARHPQSPCADEPIELGANCQRFAYAILRLFEIEIPPFRSSELWTDTTASILASEPYRPLDLVLFNDSPDAFGAHVGLLMAPDQILHLNREVGRPALWSWADFGNRPRYRQVVGVKRPLSNHAPS